MRPQSLYGRIALVFVLVLLGLAAALGALSYHDAKQHQAQVLQRVSLGLAAYVAEQIQPMDADEAKAPRTRAFFHRLMTINPNIEIYLLDPDGWITLASPSSGTPVRNRIDLAPLRQLQRSQAVLPVLGENPLHADGREIFSVAPIQGRGADGQTHVTGYVYIVLLNDMYRQLVEVAWKTTLRQSIVWIVAGALLVALIIGLGAFALVTRRLQRLITEVDTFAMQSTRGEPLPELMPPQGDEIARLAGSFGLMRQRLRMQMSELKHQDELRRELVANVSHDLRTPLTSMQGYLETLARMDNQLSPADRRHYLDVAVRQSLRVSRMAHQLFELAHLEYEQTQPQLELFCMAELIQDVAQKYALTTRAKALALHTRVESESMPVRGDIGMIERVISNLLDNAIRHTPEQGEVTLEARMQAHGVEVCVSDTGPGIAAEHLPGLLERDSPLRQMAIQRGGGLGLLIVKRILSLHSSRIRATSQLGRGTQISFVLPIKG